MYYNIKIKSNIGEYTIESKDKDIVQSELDLYFDILFKTSEGFNSDINKIDIASQSDKKNKSSKRQTSIKRKMMTRLFLMAANRKNKNEQFESDFKKELRPKNGSKKSKEIQASPISDLKFTDKTDIQKQFKITQKPTSAEKINPSKLVAEATDEQAAKKKSESKKDTKIKEIIEPKEENDKNVITGETIEDAILSVADEIESADDGLYIEPVDLELDDKKEPVYKLGLSMHASMFDSNQQNQSHEIQKNLTANNVQNILKITQDEIDMLNSSKNKADTTVEFSQESIDYIHSKASSNINTYGNLYDFIDNSKNNTKKEIIDLKSDDSENEPALTIDFGLYFMSFAPNNITDKILICAYYIKNTLNKKSFTVKFLNKKLYEASGEIASTKDIKEMVKKKLLIKTVSQNSKKQYKISLKGEMYFIDKLQAK